MWSRNFLVLAMLLAFTPALAGEDEAIVRGRELMTQNQCNGACHQAKAPEGDPAKLYTRANAKVKSLDGLKRQVERCVAMVGAHVAPDEIDSVVAALNADYYKFK